MKWAIIHALFAIVCIWLLADLWDHEVFANYYSHQLRWILTAVLIRWCALDIYMTIEWLVRWERGL